MNTILVIDDNKLNLKLVRGLIKISDPNHEIIEAFDAESGLALARKHNPDIILMDIQLPGMDGVQATREIKNDEQLKDIPVLALTSYAMSGDRRKALEAGCDDYIIKPLNTTEFLKIINEYF